MELLKKRLTLLKKQEYRGARQAQRKAEGEREEESKEGSL